MTKNLLYIQQLLHILTCFLNCLGGKLSFVYGYLFCLFISAKIEVFIIITFIISVSIQ